MTSVAVALHLLFLWLLEFLLGGLLLASFDALLRPDWFAPLRPALRRLPIIFGLCLLFFALDMISFSTVFPWATAPHHGFRELYFSTNAFFARAAVYFLTWGWLTWRSYRNVSSGGSWMLVLMLFTGTFASFDWLMSLDLQMHSTVFGLIFLASCVLISYALVLVHCELPADKRIYINSVYLAITGAWTYLIVSQYLTIWSGNLPAEAHYFLVRGKTPWTPLALALALGQFVLPVILLLFRKLKSSVTFTRTLAFSTVVLQTVFLVWSLLPNYHPDQLMTLAEVVMLCPMLVFASFIYRRSA